mmetsp:Transcript_1361/g.3330  ORF Transcript_1361/g.3330 Transcript_1361/m.3330 type:complete len:245 (+) Transcript_1361:508-1242(+)
MKGSGEDLWDLQRSAWCQAEGVLVELDSPTAHGLAREVPQHHLHANPPSRTSHQCCSNSQTSSLALPWSLFAQHRGHGPQWRRRRCSATICGPGPGRVTMRTVAAGVRTALAVLVLGVLHILLPSPTANSHLVLHSLHRFSHVVFLLLRLNLLDRRNTLRVEEGFGKLVVHRSQGRDVRDEPVQYPRLCRKGVVCYGRPIAHDHLLGHLGIGAQHSPVHVAAVPKIGVVALIGGHLEDAANELF